MADERKVLEHTAQQIDEGISRSLPGGAIDLAIDALHDGVVADVNQLKEDIDKKLKSTPNMFNKDSEDLYHGFFSGTSFTQNENYRMTHPIMVKKGVMYKFNFPSEDIGSNNRCVEVDENDNYVDWFTVTINGNYATFVSNSADRLVRFNIGKTARVENFIFSEEAKFPERYLPYGNYIENDVKMNNPLWGKKLGFTGDSICAGFGDSGGYPKYIGLNNNAVVQNIAVSGGTIINSDSRFCISESIAILDDDVDYVILEGGVNDASLALPLGTITVSYWRAFDTSTFYGAFEMMLKDTLERFAGKKIGYIIPHKCTGGFADDIGNGEVGEYYTAVKKCCKKWGIPVLDLSESVPPFAFFSSEYPNLRAIRDKYTLLRDDGVGDGWHPNKEGYQTFYVPQIERWMKTL